MQDMSPGVAPDLLFPLSLGMNERLRRPILDHMLLKTLQAYTKGETEKMMYNA